MLVKPHHLTFSTDRFLKLGPNKGHLPEHLGRKAFLVTEWFFELFLQKLKGRNVLVFEDKVEIAVDHTVLHLRSRVLDIDVKLSLFLILAILAKLVEHGVIG